MPLALTCGLTTMCALRPSSLVSLVLGILLLDEKEGIQGVIKLEQINKKIIVSG
jgi:hypothetical protein